jgi:membrane protein DedA with SNARE-associated domain
VLSQLIALAAGTLVSEDLTCIAAGLLIARTAIGALPAIFACAVGIYAGDLALWAAGRSFGARVLEFRRVRAALPPGGIDVFRAWFNGHARVAILGSRFAPGTRLPLYVAAGACRTSFRTFAVWSGVAVLMWTPILVAISALFGEAIAVRLAEWLALGRMVIVLVTLLSLVVWRLALVLITRRGRQQAIARVSKIWRWEFWPMWLFYAPVAVWTAWLALRHGGFVTVSAANPGISDGGIVGESKFDILSRLPSDSIIPSALLGPGAVVPRLDVMRRTMKSRDWKFPVVLKPDVGQRGTGVRLISTQEEAVRYLSQTRQPVLLQPYHAGPFEAGIFYYRLPEWSRGRILTITDKHFPFVIGDGVSRIEDLVWSHDRYRMQADVFLTRLGDRRHAVPAPGEYVPLGIAGNHAQGTMFKDGCALVTPALERRIDDIACQYKGFFIGRFDVRYRDRLDFMNGRDLAIVELNGATAECTNIYDPERSLWSAYRQLFRQWSLVFAIGAANRRAGKRGSSMGRLWFLVRQHLAMPSPFPVSD